MPGGVRTEIHLGSADTDGAFCLLVDYPPAGWSLPAHRHVGVTETIHVLDGEFEMTVGDRRSLLTAGQTVYVPADALHAGENVGAATGRRVVIFSPAGMEDLFLEIGALSADVEAAPAEALAAAKRHGWRFAS